MLLCVIYVPVILQTGLALYLHLTVLVHMTIILD